MNLILFDDPGRNRLFPFTHTRPVADIRCGILTSRERWEQLLSKETSTLTVSYLQPEFPLRLQSDNLYINGGVIATAALRDAVLHLKPGEALRQNKTLLAFHSRQPIDDYKEIAGSVAEAALIDFPHFLLKLEQVWDIFAFNDQAIAIDFKLLTAGRSSAPLPEFVTALHPERIFIEEGAMIHPGILNATDGYIYIGKQAEVMDGCMLRGSVALGAHAVLKMGAKVYGASTIGPGCKVGGEVNNVVFFNHSNKGHDGFLGNAVIGDWCNLGADTNCSNLKNNYGEVSIWSEQEHRAVSSGLQFCGLLMGDHSKCGINTMFNTGTVVGVSCNIFGAGFPAKFIPSFSWGGPEGMVTYEFEKALEAANRMMTRRECELSPEAVTTLKYIFEHTQHQRNQFH